MVRESDVVLWGRAPVVHEYAKAVHQATGTALILVPPEPPSRRLHFGLAENPFCAAMSRTVGGCQACLRVQRELCVRLSHKLAPHAIRCFAGLMDFVVPVLIGGQHRASFLGGHVLCEKPTQRGFAKVSAQLVAWGLKRDLPQLEAAYFQTPVLSEAQLRAIMRVVTYLAQNLAEWATHQAVVRGPHEPLPIRQVKEFAAAHLGDHQLLPAAARQVHLHPCYLSRLFKKATGIHFIDYVSRVRVEKAKRLLIDPSSRINEIAYACGFGSIPHFNRVFKKHTGMAPTVYRNGPKSKSVKEKSKSA